MKPIAFTGEPRLVLNLLRYAADGQPLDTANGSGKLEFNQHQLAHVLNAGLGALMYRATSPCIHRMPPSWRDALLSADLTAKVRHANLIDTANDVIDTCSELNVPVTLLKGISISEQHYPVGYLRPMGDIDILVPAQSCTAIETALMRRGYIQNTDHDVSDDAHHRLPLFHPQRQAWVELHTALFRKSARLSRDTVFGLHRIAAQSVASTFHGRPVKRLTDELQLVYIASSWIKDLCEQPIHSSSIIALLDAVFLLNACGRTLDWDGMIARLDNSTATASIYLMLAYLCEHTLGDSADPVLPRLASKQDIIGPAELKIINAILHKYLVCGQPFSRLFTEWHATVVLTSLLTPGPHAAKLLSLAWNLVFPPTVPDRYTARYQLARISRALRRTG